MRLIFLIPLTTGLLVGHIAQKSADEIAYLTGAFALINLLLSLILAPWQIQLLLLILVILTARQFWLKLEARIQPDALEKEEPTQVGIFNDATATGATTNSTPNQANKVVRQYRGVSYETNSPTIPLADTEKVGKYRGKSLPVGQPQQVRRKLPKLAIKYRGISLIPQPSPQEKIENGATENGNSAKDSQVR